MRTAGVALRDGRLASDSDALDSGLAVRVLVDGVWGFAATDELTPEAAARTAERALEIAKARNKAADDEDD